jgi:hypothetical protein
MKLLERLDNAAFVLIVLIASPLISYVYKRI